MGKIEIIIVAVLEIIENMLFCYVVLKKRKQKASWKKRVGLVGAVILFFVLWVWGFGYYPVLFIASNAVLILLMQYLYGMSLTESFRVWFFLFSFLSIVETVFGSIADLAVGQRSLFLDIFFCSMAVILFLGLYHFLIGRKIDREKFQMPLRLWVMAEGLLFIYMLMVTYFSHLLQFVKPARLVMIGTVLIALGGVGTFGMILTIMYYFNGTAKYKIQSEMAEMYNEQQKDYFLNLLERETETKKFRHDIINHFMVIQSFCQKEDTQIKNYISNLLDENEGIFYNQFDVGNDVINVIINYYFVPIQKKCDIAIKGCAGELEAIPGADLCVIVSNLVKNAAEAASCVQKGKGKIHFFISEGNQYLSIRVENSYEGDIAFGKEGMPKTSKAEKDIHGFGIWNVKEAVEKYQGRLKIEAEDNWYIAEVFMKIA